MDGSIQPHTYVALRLPSDAVKVQQIIPNTNISLGKYGAFSSNHIIGRPYHLTFEIQDTPEESGKSSLRIVPPAELYEDVKEEGEDQHETATQAGTGGEEFELVNQEGKVVMRTNRNVMDDGSSQKLTGDDIEALKKGETASGRDTIAKILESHTALDKKTAFSLAKYTLRKRKKYLRRFTVLPLDVPQLANYFLHEKEARSIMEIREEILSLVLSWSNVHCGGSTLVNPLPPPTDPAQVDHNRFLVVDETGGLIVCALAERMGILHAPTSTPATPTLNPNPRDAESAPFATSNTITLVHPANQPNLSLLSYFNYDVSNPSSTHPLYSHLKTLSWLQLVSPAEDTAYREPAKLSAETLSGLKPGKRAAYYRKRKRWVRVSSIIDEARAGGFAGLVVASAMVPTGILHTLVPLLRGGAQVVVYAANVEPLVRLMDAYSTPRRTAFVNLSPEERSQSCPTEDFPVDPTLLLGTAVHTARARPWQVLPGRTHPLMMGKGGAEGFVFVGMRVLPSEGKVEARGQFKRRKKETATSAKEAVRVEGGSVGTQAPVQAEAALEAAAHTEENNIKEDSMDTSV